MDIGVVYAAGRERVTGLLEELSDDGAATPVPTCPEWTVHDVVAHLAGTCTDILSGNIDGVATDGWTAAQVDARRDRSLAELLAEWNDAGPQVEALAGAFPGRAGEQWVTDATTHEHDIRVALGAHGARESDAVAIALDFLVTAGFASSLVHRGLGAVEVRAGDRRWLVGGGEAPTAWDTLLAADVDAGSPSGGDGVEPSITLSATPFELFRALTGRRSAAQIAAYDWSGDPAPYVDAFIYGPFKSLSAHDIEE